MKNRFVPILALAGVIMAAAACSPAASSTTSAPAASGGGTGGIAQQPIASCTAVTDPNINMPANGYQQQFSAPEQVIDNSHTYCAIVITDHGRFIIQLYPQNAPKNVNNFVFLASKGFYDNMGFHRVISGFMAQTGDPTGKGDGGPGYDNIPLEGSGPLKYDKPGVVGVARTSAPDSAGSQFFITFAPTAPLDNAYSIIGEVVSGMDVVNQIRIRDVDQDPNAGSIPPEKLVSIRVVDIGAK